MESGERQQVVANCQQQFRCLFLDHDANVFAYVKRIDDDVMSKDCCASRRGPRQRGQDAKRCRLPRAIWPEQAKDGAAFDGEAQIIDRSKFFVGPASIDFDEMVNSNRNVVHDQRSV
jgi:hypothetical protein